MLDDFPLSSYTTLPKGWYRFDGVQGGTHSLSVSRSGYSSDSVSNVSVSPNHTTQAPDLVIDPLNWGIWRINNDTSGNLTLDVKGLGIDQYGPGIYDWILPSGTYEYTAWTTACKGVIDTSVEIRSSYIHTTRFYCADGTTSSLDALSVETQTAHSSP